MFDLISTGPFECGETPLWNEKGYLYWVDAANHKIFRRKISDGSPTEKFSPDLPLTAIRAKEGGGFYLLTKWGLAVWTPEGGESGTVHRYVEVLDSSKSIRFNDGVPTGDGGFIAGAFNEADLLAGDGVLMYMDMEGKTIILGENLHVPNGVAIDPAGGAVLMAEMYKNRVLSFPVDQSWELAGRVHTKLTIPSEEGKPDGLTFDEKGGLWIAHWQGSRISRFNAEGIRTKMISTPFPTPTCVCFDAEGTLYTTSATLELTKETLTKIKNPGGVFAYPAALA